MTDIIDETEKRLGSMVPQAVYDLAREAATLRAENERLREALREIESNWETPMDDKAWRAVARFMWEAARAALTEPTKENTHD